MAAQRRVPSRPARLKTSLFRLPGSACGASSQGYTPSVTSSGRSLPSVIGWSPTRREHEGLKLSPDVIGLAVREDERDAPRSFEASVRSGPCEQQALGAAALGRRPAAHQERLGAAVLALDPGTVASAGQVRAAEPLRDDPLETVLPGRGQHRLCFGVEVARRPPARPIERQIQQ